MVEGAGGRTRRRHQPADAILGDNRGALALARNPEYHAAHEAHQHSISFHQGAIDNGSITYDYLQTKEMPADALTKPLGPDKHYTFAEAMGLAF